MTAVDLETYMRRFLSFSVPLLGLLFGQGCDSGTENTGTPSTAKPSITLYATGFCGMAEGATNSDLEDSPQHGIDIQVRGIDSATSSGIMTAGTEVELTQSGDGAAIFASTIEDKQSESVTLTFSGRVVEDKLYCVSAGQFTLKAKITGYDFNEEALTLESEVIVNCLSLADFEEECPEASSAVVDAGIDSGPLPVEACLNDLDQRAIDDETLDVFGKAVECGAGCAAETGDLVECSSACVITATRISDDCATCYAHLVSCSFESCSTECETDPTAEECLTCLSDEGCSESFLSCSGLEFNPGGDTPDAGVGPVVDLCQNDPDSVIILDETINVIHKVLECGNNCSNEENPLTCLGSCIRQATGLTEECTSCYSTLIACTVENCSEPCREGFSNNCESCQEEQGCVIPYFDCSGNDVVDAVRTPPPQSWSISFVPQDEMEIGIRGTGAGREDNIRLVFNIKELDEPLAGVAVKFLMPDNPPPGIGIDPRSKISDENGVVTTRIIAGGTPGVLTIEARACRYGFEDGSDVLCRSPLNWNDETDGDWVCSDTIRNGCPEAARSGTVVIRGGVPSMRAFDFWCEDSIIPAFSDRPLIESWLLVNGEQTTCHVRLGDRLNGIVDTATPVFFLTEAGTITQSGSTGPEGVASTTHRTGQPSPVDIPVRPPLPMDIPNTADAALSPPLGHEIRDLDKHLYLLDDRNFRDGLVTIVAVTRGEENFIDSDGNKIYESGVDIFPPEYDLTAPYVDSNDNRIYDQYCNENGGGEDCEHPGRYFNEEFRRTSDDDEFTIAYDPEAGYFGNGEWDGDIEIWNSTKVIWTGEMTNFSIGEITNKSYVLFNVEGAANFEGSPCPEDTIFTEPGSRVTITANFVDINGNCLGANGEGHFSFDEDNNYVLLGGVTDGPIDGDYCTTFNAATEEVIPSSAPFQWVIMDNGSAYVPDDPPAPEAEFKNHRIRLNYRVAGRDVDFEYTFRTCRLK